LDPLTAGLLYGGANLLGGLFGFFGQRSANEMNMQISQKQMDFQERMSNSAIRRQQQDMKEAGINPLLAGMQGGAGAGPGASIAAQNPVPEGSMQAAVSSALDARRIMADVENVEADTKIKKAEGVVAEGMSKPFKDSKSILPWVKTISDMIPGGLGQLLRRGQPGGRTGLPSGSRTIEWKEKR